MLKPVAVSVVAAAAIASVVGCATSSVPAPVFTPKPPATSSSASTSPVHVVSKSICTKDKSTAYCVRLSNNITIYVSHSVYDSIRPGNVYSPATGTFDSPAPVTTQSAHLSAEDDDYRVQLFR
jgi:hypothetical protein